MRRKTQPPFVPATIYKDRRSSSADSLIHSDSVNRILLSKRIQTVLIVASQIAKSAETDFEQSMLSMFDNKKGTNLKQSL